MRGETMKAFRERRGLNQAAFAGWLNERLQRRYDNRRVSRWESGAEAIPRPVAALLRQEAKGMELGGGPALTVAVANQKGGVGKTVTAVNLATLLARRASVLLVDLDPQANATLHVGVNAMELQERRRTLTNVIRGEAALTDVVLTLDSGLQIVPSSIGLSEVEAELMSEPLGALTMRELLAEARKIFDCIIIDTAPNLGMLTVNGITASDTVLIPCQPEMPAIIGIEYLLRTINKVQRRTNATLSVLGILPSMYSARLTSDRAMLDAMRERYEAFRIFDPIARSTTFSQANAAALPTVLAAADFPGREVYEVLADAVLAERAKRLEAVHAA
ncbi:AAA family ATPase [Azospirillum halopraeferens]|uniref:AAA family ATPase n=1 Tax=Azospirillum halopraeferens TaxID=34010 RepID=UPI0004062419|nr:AAA family ATPase [Azospirillum halopraeferens]